MQLIRTTVRLQPQLKKAAEYHALQLNTTFQDILERALETYITQKSQQRAQKLVFKDKDMGVALDNLDREALYAD